MIKLASKFNSSSFVEKLLTVLATVIGLSWLITTSLGLKIGYDPQNKSCLDFTVSLIHQDKAHQFKPGEILAFNPEVIMPGKFQDVLLGKLVVGVPGDTINSSSLGVYINGKKIVDDFPVSEPVFAYTGKIPDGQYFGIGTVKGSYDSRYFGFIPQSAIYGAVKPIY